MFWMSWSRRGKRFCRPKFTDLSWSVGLLRRKIQETRSLKFFFLGRTVRLGIGSGLNFCCVEKDWLRQDSLDGVQYGQETQ